jgi:hypothetical protein
MYTIVIKIENIAKSVHQWKNNFISETCCQTLKHFDNDFATGGNNIVEMLGSSIPTRGELH